MKDLQQRALIQSALFIFLIVGLFVSSAGAQSTSEKWSNIGPDGVHAESITVDPIDHNTLYVGTRVGAFKSTDGGQHWFNTNTNKGLPNLDVYSVVVDPVDNKNVYLLTPYYVMKSTDAARTWSRLHLKMDPVLGREVVPNQLFIDYIDSKTIFAWTPLGLMKTTDGGNKWDVIQIGLQSAETILTVYLDPDNHTILYAGVRKYASTFPFAPFQDRVLQSTDSGVSWHEIINNNVVINGDTVKINAASLLPGPNIAGYSGFFVGDCADGDTCPNIECINFGSAGLNCTHPFDGPPFKALFRSQGNNSKYFESYLEKTLNISCFSSCPGGQFPFSVFSYVVTDQKDLDTFYVAGIVPLKGQDLFKSTDGGRTWTSIGKGLNNSTINSLAIDPTQPGVVFAGRSDNIDQYGISKKMSEQTAFTPIVAPALKGKTFNIITIDAHSPNVILAAGGGTIYRSSDSGLTWNIGLDFSHHDPQQFDPMTTAIVFESPNSDTVYVAFNTFGQNVSPGIMKSNDGGLTWAAANTGLPNFLVDSLAADTHIPGTLYAGVSGNVAILFKTTDGGNSWQSIDPPGSCCGYYLLAVDPLHSGTVYAFGSPFMKTVDGGATWTTLFTPQSTDRYQMFSQGLGSIVFDPLHPDTLYAGTNTYPFRILGGNRDNLFKGVFKSTNGGLSWWPANDGLTTPQVTSLAFDNSTGKLYAGTDGGGVFVTQPTVSARTGDVNGDGKVDVQDLIMLANVLAGNVQADPFAADVYADGRIDVQDLLALCQYLVGNVKKLPIVPPR